MKINKKLLPMKGHYFFQEAGLAPIAPFLPVIAKDLGFSVFVVGTIFTVTPLLSFIIKPLLGGIADKYQCQKGMFLMLLVVQYLFFLGTYWMPALPVVSSTFICEDDIKLKICSGRLDENLTLQNGLCQVDCSRTHIKNVFSIHLNGKSSFHDKGCLYFPAKMENETFPCNITSNLCKTTCEDPVLSNILSSSYVSDQEVIKHYQFWLLFSFIVIPKIASIVTTSIGDAICFNLLGENTMDYGLQRLWGAIGWGLMSLTSGLIVDIMSEGSESKIYTSAYYFLIIFSILDCIVSYKLDFKVASPPPKNIVKDIFKVVKNPQVFIFMLWCFINGIFTAMIWYFLFWFLEDVAANNGHGDMKFIKTLEGLVLTFHCYMGEVPFFFVSSKLIKKLGYANAMTLVLVGFAVRFIYYSYLKNPWMTLPAEMLNGITYGIFYTTLTTYACTFAPPGTETTIQNLVAALFDGLGVSIGSFVGGYMMQKMGGAKTFWYFGLTSAFFAIVHFIIHLFLKEPKYLAVSTEIKAEYRRPSVPKCIEMDKPKIDK